jgi:hypothetical protein
MGFIILLGLTTISIAGCAAYFSVYGLAQIFSGTFIPIIIMGGALEAGKLVAASYVYRYWHMMSKVIASYLIIAVIVLMVITSAGIFSFLSAGYQADILPLKLKKQQVELLTYDKQHLERLKETTEQAKTLIDKDIANLPSNYISGRIRLDKMYKTDKTAVRQQLTIYNTDIRELTIKISKLKSEILQDQVHIGPIIFIAEALNKTTDQATTILIIMIICVFDPLAVALTVGLNNALLQRKNKPQQILNESTIEEISEKPETIDPEDVNIVTGLNGSQQEILDEMATQKEVTTNVRNPKR